MINKVFKSSGPFLHLVDHVMCLRWDLNASIDESTGSMLISVVSYDAAAATEHPPRYIAPDHGVDHT